MDKRIIDMTASEFSDMLSEALARAGLASAPGTERGKRYVYGIAGIAQLFGCSLTTANRIKASGRIDRAISQSGRKITVDADLALHLYRLSN